MSEGQPQMWSVYLGTDDADATERNVQQAGGKVILRAGDVGKSGVSDPDATSRKASELGGRVNSPAADFRGGRLAVLGDPQGAVFGILRMNRALGGEDDPGTLPRNTCVTAR